MNWLNFLRLILYFYDYLYSMLDHQQFYFVLMSNTDLSTTYTSRFQFGSMIARSRSSKTFKQMVEDYQKHRQNHGGVSEEFNKGALIRLGLWTAKWLISQPLDELSPIHIREPPFREEESRSIINRLLFSPDEQPGLHRHNQRTRFEGNQNRALSNRQVVQRQEERREVQNSQRNHPTNIQKKKLIFRQQEIQQEKKKPPRNQISFPLVHTLMKERRAEIPHTESPQQRLPPLRQEQRQPLRIQTLETEMEESPQRIKNQSTINRERYREANREGPPYRRPRGNSNKRRFN